MLSVMVKVCLHSNEILFLRVLKKYFVPLIEHKQNEKATSTGKCFIFVGDTTNYISGKYIATPLFLEYESQLELLSEYSVQQAIFNVSKTYYIVLGKDIQAQHNPSILVMKP